MRGPESIVSTLINLAVIFFIIRVVAKATKKFKQNTPGSTTQPEQDKTANPGYRKVVSVGSDEHTKDIPAGNLHYERKSIAPRKVRFDTKQKFDENIQLKRCPNCGGEIPVMMMKCEICGHRQTGCSVGLIILILLVAFMIGMVLLNNQGVPVWSNLQMLFR